MKLLSGFIIIVSLSFLAISCTNGEDKPVEPTVERPTPMSFSVINTFPHDTSSFTEGLLFYKGDLYEGTGDYGYSKLLKVDLNTGKPLQSTELPKEYFGEGIVIVNDTVYQLTYREKVGFMYSVKDFKKIGQFSFSSPEGWGMTTNGKEIIASDGGSNLFFYQAGTFRLLKTMPILESGSLAFNINELEYIDGFIYANQYLTPYILKIDANTGVVVAKADMTSLTNEIKSKYPDADVLNGIAYNDSTKKIYITGKKWPVMYEVTFSK